MGEGRPDERDRLSSGRFALLRPQIREFGGFENDKFLVHLLPGLLGHVGVPLPKFLISRLNGGAVVALLFSLLSR